MEALCQATPGTRDLQRRGIARNAQDGVRIEGRAGRHRGRFYRRLTGDAARPRHGEPWLLLAPAVALDEGEVRALVDHAAAGGLVLWALGTPPLLRSTWSIGAALAAAAWVALRTSLEDATLREELPGYQEYCRRTRFRLVPGIW